MRASNASARRNSKLLDSSSALAKLELLQPAVASDRRWEFTPFSRRARENLYRRDWRESRLLIAIPSARKSFPMICCTQGVVMSVSKTSGLAGYFVQLWAEPDRGSVVRRSRSVLRALWRRSRLLEFSEPRSFAPNTRRSTIPRNLRFNFAKNYTAFCETRPDVGRSYELKIHRKPNQLAFNSRRGIVTPKCNHASYVCFHFLNIYISCIKF